MKLKRIYFTVMMPSGSMQEHAYMLGEGPCGKVVSKLSVISTRHTITITQYHTDGTHKIFTYPWKLVESKVTEEYVL
ncbi:hypothetical protein HOU66_gp06 [Pectobacterium phage Arno160]|uniref:Uncharacterized protein n=1 Tax=Pectobacterium phage Arno160 TaxID=2488835 RepID=A0A3G8F253_9CAUD|nr:hypothetical protein HOU66_gp06 [Pectobacterium phage Arno160]AZF88068.1 hypothetical protein Arno160_gp06 [Pectobacterium phage Arno160]